MTGPSVGPRSRLLFRAARRRLVGGVNSPVRSFAQVGGTPAFIARGEGAWLIDVDGRRYLDLVNSWGANLLGHAPPKVVAAVAAAASEGLSFGAPTERELRLAERIHREIPTMERIRFVASGTEAVMSAVRVARGATGRSRIVKFAGGYHGHMDGLLVRAGSGVAAAGRPDSSGVPFSVARETTVLPYNDADSTERFFGRHSEEIAAVIVEPIAANMGLVPPIDGFLSTLERLSHDAGALLIADEVITGFRLGPGAVHTRWKIHADLVTLGKIIGAGLPVGAYGGAAAQMDLVAPQGPVYQAGTLAGNPVAMAAGLSLLSARNRRTYRDLETSGRALAEILRSEAERAGVTVTVTQEGSMVGLFFAESPIRDLEDALRSDRKRYARFFHAALSSGVYLPPSPMETIFASTRTTPDLLERHRIAFRRAFRAAAATGK
jgi:glutamate-1-semialdehyde 2,1-aminomutase